MNDEARRRWPHPIFLDLAGRRVVVVGGGTVAERKIEALIAAGADVTVVSPDVTDFIEGHAAGGRLRLDRRPYRRGDLAG